MLGARCWVFASFCTSLAKEKKKARDAEIDQALMGGDGGDGSEDSQNWKQ